MICRVQIASNYNPWDTLKPKVDVNVGFFLIALTTLYLLPTDQETGPWVNKTTCDHRRPLGTTFNTVTQILNGRAVERDHCFWLKGPKGRPSRLHAPCPILEHTEL